MKALSNSGECPSCGGGHKSRPFCVYENGCYCFSCGYGKSVDKGYTIKTVKTPTSPDWPDAVSNVADFTIAVQKWLARFGITNEMCRKHKILSCDDDSVIYINCDSSGALISYQRRWIASETRKIITRGVKTPSVLLSENSDDTKTFVICEDFLSSIRVSKIFDTVCLWGTKIEYTFLQDLLKRYDRCLVWLDNDKQKEVNSGQIAAEKICKTARSILNYRYKAKSFSAKTQEVFNIISDLDPKCYTDTEIKEFTKKGIANDVKFK